MNKIEKACLRLITQFICILVIASELIATRSNANIFPVEDLQPDQLVGPWEALVQREGVVGPSIYQMLFVSPQEAWLVQAISDSDFADVHFFGRLVSEDLAKGQIKLEFTPLQGQSKSAYISVRIEGRASRSGDLKTIEGKIIQRREDGKVTIEHVFFANNLWTRWIANASVIAERAILEERRKDEGGKNKQSVTGQGAKIDKPTPASSPKAAITPENKS